MKKLANIIGVIIMITVFTLNITSTMSSSKDLGYNSIKSIFMLNTASAESGPHEDCRGHTCNDAGGQSTGTSYAGNGNATCCAVGGSGSKAI